MSTADKTNDDPNKASRRTFIKAAGAAAVAAGTVGPTVLGATDKAGTKNAVIGSGEHTYECLHNWGELPDSVKWGETHGVAIDEAGLIYIKHRNRAEMPMDAIVVFDPEGKFVRSFGKEYHAGGHGIDIRKENGQEYLYLCDVTKRQVIKSVFTADRKGEQVWKMCYPFEAGVYQKVSQFSPDQRGLRTRRRLLCRRRLRLELHPPVRQGRPLGAHLGRRRDRDRARCRRRTASGSTIAPAASRRWSSPTGPTPGCNTSRSTASTLSFVNDVSFPAHFDIRGDRAARPRPARPRHDLRQGQQASSCTWATTPNGRSWCWKWTRQEIQDARQPARWEAGKFIHPHDACYDKDGNIFVVEWVPTGRVTKLRKV